MASEIQSLHRRVEAMLGLGALQNIMIDLGWSVMSLDDGGKVRKNIEKRGRDETLHLCTRSISKTS